MITIQSPNSVGLQRVLAAENRSPEIAAPSDVYGFLVGAWELNVRHYWGNDVSGQHLRGELHAGWVLEGRAIQDVWIMPPRDERTADVDKQLNMYGTTLRVWDASLDAWRITWLNPAGDHYEQQIGRRIGPDIVQIGARPNGTPTRWRFIEITRDSFHWLGESLDADGQTWNLEGEFLATRTSE
jgi:hypothetical protein